jgi:Cu/Zn superoxide dismutase
VTIFSAALLVVVVGGPTTAVQAHGRRARTTLRDAAGHEVGRVKFVQRDGKVIVSASVTRQTPGFHGSHIHANDDPANGQGCIADPAQAPSTWLVSADGHLKAAGQTTSSSASSTTVMDQMPAGSTGMTRPTGSGVPTAGSQAPGPNGSCRRPRV